MSFRTLVFVGTVSIAFVVEVIGDDVTVVFSIEIGNTLVIDVLLFTGVVGNLITSESFEDVSSDGRLSIEKISCIFSGGVSLVPPDKVSGFF